MEYTSETQSDSVKLHSLVKAFKPLLYMFWQDSVWISSLIDDKSLGWSTNYIFGAYIYIEQISWFLLKHQQVWRHQASSKHIL